MRFIIPAMKIVLFALLGVVTVVLCDYGYLISSWLGLVLMATIAFNE